MDSTDGFEIIVRQAVAYASPRITVEQWQSGEKNDIDIFEDQVRGWFFDQIRALRSRNNPDHQHSGPAVLALVTPYFEMLTAYHEGRASERGETTKFLKRGLEAVLGTSFVPAIDRFVVEVRNGLFHELVFRTVLIHTESNSDLPNFGIQPAYRFGEFEPSAELLCVNPFWLADEAEQYLNKYLTHLRSPGSGDQRELLKRFDAFMAVRKSREPGV